jgi:virginiamycin B lyase
VTFHGHPRLPKKRVVGREVWDAFGMLRVRPLSLVLALLVIVAAVPSIASASKLKLQRVAGLPPNNTRDVANGPHGEVWMTSGDPRGVPSPRPIREFVARISGAGKLLKVVPVASQPDSITSGPDGAMWFTLRDTGVVGRVTRGGGLRYFPVPLPPGSQPRRIVTGPDRALWVTLFGASAVGRLTPQGKWTIFQTGLTPGGQQLGLATGPGGLWLTEPRADRIVRLSTAGKATGFPVSNVSGPEDITRGFDGNMWFTEDDGDRIGKVTPRGKVTEYSAGITPGANPMDIVSGPDDAMWFTEGSLDRVARATPDGYITEYEVPRGSIPRGIALGPDHKLWVSFAGTGNVVRFTPPLAPVIPAVLNWSASRNGNTIKFDQLAVDGIPPGGRVQVLCDGKGCPRHRVIRKGRNVDLRKLVPRVDATARLQVRLMATGYSTRVRIFRFLPNGAVVADKRCIAPRGSKLLKGCG